MRSALSELGELSARARDAVKRTTLDLKPYLTAIRTEHGFIDIRGLHVGSGKVHRFPMDELYVPLRMSRESRLVIVGDPGARYRFYSLRERDPPW